MKVTVYMVVGSGEADRYLPLVLPQFTWVDEVAICLNRPDKKTENLVKRHATLVHRDDREWGREQWRIKQEFLDVVSKKLKPDWIWPLDADEVYPSFNRKAAESLSSGYDIAWQFWCLQLWNSDDHVRADLCFPNVRFYRFMPEFDRSFQSSALHCGLAPLYAYKFASQSSQYFLHHGLKTIEDRTRKRQRYLVYDPDAKYKAKEWYQGLANEKVEGEALEEVLARLPETLFRSKKAKNHMPKDTTVFMFRNKWGKSVPAIGQKQREQFLKVGMQELSEIHVNANPEAEVIKAEPITEYDQREVEQVPEDPATPSAPKRRGRPSTKKGSKRSSQ